MWSPLSYLFLISSGHCHIMPKHMSEDLSFLLLHASLLLYIHHTLHLRWLKATRKYPMVLSGSEHGQFIFQNLIQMLNAQGYVSYHSLHAIPQEDKIYLLNVCLIKTEGTLYSRMPLSCYVCFILSLIEVKVTWIHPIRKGSLYSSKIFGCFLDPKAIFVLLVKCDILWFKLSSLGCKPF